MLEREPTLQTNSSFEFFKKHKNLENMKNRLKSLLLIIISIISYPFKRYVEPVMVFLDATAAKAAEYASSASMLEINPMNFGAAINDGGVKQLAKRDESITQSFIQAIFQKNSDTEEIAQYIQDRFIGTITLCKIYGESTPADFVTSIDQNFIYLLAFIKYNEIKSVEIYDAIAIKMLMMGKFGNTPYTEKEARFLVSIYRFLKA